MSEMGGPTVRRRRLGSELRRLREAANLDQAAAARHLECSTSKISRLEKGKGLAKAIELRSLLDLYKVTDDEARNQLLLIHRQAAETGWWEQAEYEQVLPSGHGVYVGLESDARSVQTWQLGFVPGLLQTEDYARAVLSDARRQSADVDRLVHVRMQRQARLADGPDALDVWAVIDEGALLRPVGGPDVMRAQVQALIAAAERPNITIQVCPLAKGAHPGLAGSFSILEFGPSDPRVGYVDGRGGALFVERDEPVRQLIHDFDRMRAVALDEYESAALLRDLIAAKETQ
ncbi:helix-turn-helix transcriptional regulator [Streptomyces sp. H10-C2]|uniref:helix-turn-helix domain-containing protein n=1 Tax=Streptomyces TaxID=1883 RepID=UPI0018E023D0|nr:MULTISPECIES: helix-turn-helix transcriptional regulator [Streptomyces]MDJ0344221.1 helix-turn-helix transcriptional regulator [Streptomyces sp. PH10-H1]MDJ0373559.1 helix-turn-helix transcriptional regulator [Streptomyces sp. H10-C2]